MSIPVAVLGATGYAGELAVRILLGHPSFTLVHVGSDRLGGTRYADAVPAFAGATDLVLAPDTPEALLACGARAVVLAKKSPEVTRLVPRLLAAGVKLVDIGAEFRLRTLSEYVRWYKGPHECPDLLTEAVYGLSEWHTEAIRRARVVGNPGCYATSILLPLLPLVRAGLLDAAVNPVSVSYSGLSGAGRKYAEDNSNLFWAVNENLHSYKALTHQHQAEIDQELSSADAGAWHLHFVPHLAPITRGIHSTIACRLRPGVDRTAVEACWRTTYAGRPFVRICTKASEVEVATVTGSNRCDVAATVEGSQLVICSTLDNLVKGASGQAVQNLNLLFGLDEGMGLLGRVF